MAEWLRRRPAKPVGSARVGSNPTGVDSFVNENIKYLTQKERKTFTLVSGSVSEWLRSRTRNPMGSAREGSNPFAVAIVLLRTPEGRPRLTAKVGGKECSGLPRSI